ncbi:MAG: hypothetical protein QOH25_112 [Acidobacteriota bacterium]|jgi:hypothetical protein|nr:hypothetical protein [Acidobacteriota bacterium]
MRRCTLLIEAKRRIGAQGKGNAAQDEQGGETKGEFGGKLTLRYSEPEGNKGMNEETAKEELRFKVECTWCGAIIRRNSSKDSHGMCLKCYARMLGERGHEHERESPLRWARGHGSEQ